jgi:diamine N-acetyltransferase
MPLLKDDIITLRALEPTDLDALYKWENDTTLWEVGSSISPYSRKQLWEYINNYDGDIFSAHQLRMMIINNATDEVIGTIDIYDFDATNRRAAIGVLIDHDQARKGYGTAAVNLILNYASSALGLHQVYVYVPIDNKPSIKLFRKCGFKSAGCLRSWLCRRGTYADVTVMQHLFPY